MRWIVFILMLLVFVSSVSALPAIPSISICGDSVCDDPNDPQAVEVRNTGDQSTSIAFTAEEQYPVIFDPKKKKMFYAQQNPLTGKLEPTTTRIVDDPQAAGIRKLTELTPEEIRRIKQRPEGFRVRDLPDEKRRELLRKQLIINRIEAESSTGPTGNFVVEPVDLKMLVVFIEFSDQEHSSDFSFSDFNSFLDDFAEYYTEQSARSFVLDVVTVESWQMANNDQGYYGGNYEANAPELVEELVPAIDVDFSEFDSDSDGYMDGPVIVVHAGDPDENVGGNTDLIWSFYSSISGLEEDGVQIVDYILISENHNDNIGTFAHEFGHFLGLPDLYDNDPEDGESKGCGFFCLMAYGCYLDEVSPLSPWSRYFLGWNNGLSEVASSSALDLGYGEFSKIDISDDEYFFVENKPVTDFYGEDVGGILIWHVDESVMDTIGSWEGCSGTRMDCNVVNGEEEHKLVDIEEADGSGLDEWDDDSFDYGQKGDVWKYDCGVLGCTNYLFDANSVPNSLSYVGEDPLISIEILSDVGEVMGAGISLDGVEVNLDASANLDFDRSGSEDSEDVMMRFGSVNDSEESGEAVESEIDFDEEENEIEETIEEKSNVLVWIIVIIVVIITIVAVFIVFLWNRDFSD